MSSIRPDPNLLKKHPNAVTVDQLQEKDRFLGTLLGAAAGESLGAPHEGKRAGEIGPLRDITGGGPWAAGEPTDDIDLTLALLRSLVARRRFDQDDAARRYLEWFSRGPKDVGILTRASLENLRAGESAGAVSDEARAAVERGASRRPPDIAVDGDDQGYVLRTVEIAFSALATAPTFEEGLMSVVSRGGDTDTNGAV